MSCWKERGFVQDSDDEGDFSNDSQKLLRLNKVQRFQRRTSSNDTVPRTQTQRHDHGAHDQPGSKANEAEKERAAPVIDVFTGPESSSNRTYRNDSQVTKVGTPAHSRTRQVVSLVIENVSTSRKKREAEQLVDPQTLSAIEIDGGDPTLTPIPVHNSPSMRNPKNCGGNLDLIDPANQNPWEDEQLFTTRYGGRSLRQRKAIQLHPYRLEIENYRQSLKARGLRPIQIVNPTQTNTQSDHDEYSSQVDIPSSQIEEQLASSSPPQEEHTSRTLGSGFRMPPTLSNDLRGHNEQPERDDVGQNRSHAMLKLGDKRRKISRPAQPRQFTRQTAETTPDRAIRQYTISPSSSSIFDLLPSPPFSHLKQGQAVVDTAKQGSRMPRGLAPQGLPTPELSSDPQNPATPHRDQLDGDVHASTGLRSSELLAGSESTVDNSPEGSEASEAESDSQIRIIQKKIRGVLPASWLKLDHQAQTKRKGKGRPNHQLPHHESHRGVAQRVVRVFDSSPGATSAQTAPIPIYSDTDPSPNKGSKSPTPLLSRRSSSLPDTPPTFRMPLDADPGEIMEDNFVDAMLAPGPRRSRAIDQGRKRQLKLNDVFRRQRKCAKFGSSLPVPRAKHHSRAGDGQASFKRRRAQEPTARKTSNACRLSIIDNLPTSAETRFQMPRFLQVAARQVRKKENYGRHSPNSKHIQLKNQEDTADACTVLQEWRSGRLKTATPITATDHSKRRPLLERTGNPKVVSHKSSASHNYVSAKSIRPLRQHTIHPAKVSRILRPMKQRTKPDKSCEGLQPKQNVTQFPQLRQWEAQLQEPQDDYDKHHPRAAFARQLKEISRARVDDLGGTSRVALDELSSPIEGSRRPKAFNLEHPDAPMRTPTLRVRRKPLRRRVNVGLHMYHQPDEIAPSVQTHRLRLGGSSRSGKQTLQGLAGFGSGYSANFDVLPLMIGTYFHSSTFIGSGDFSKCLRMDHRISTSQMDLTLSALVRWKCYGPSGMKKWQRALTGSFSWR